MGRSLRARHHLVGSRRWEGAVVVVGPWRFAAVIAGRSRLAPLHDGAVSIARHHDVTADHTVGWRGCRQRLDGAFTVRVTRTELPTGAVFTAVEDATGRSEVGGGGGTSLANAVAGRTIAAPIINAEAAKAERLARTRTDMDALPHIWLDRSRGCCERN